MASDRESPTPGADTKPKRQPPRPRNEPRQVAPPPPPPAPPAATPIVAGDLRRSDDARRGRTGPTTHHGAGGRAPTGPLGGDWGLMAKAPPPPPPVAREERVSPDFARPPGYRPDLTTEGPRSERRQTTKPGGATADRHSQDRRSAPRGRFPAPKPQKAPKPLSGREFNDGLRRGGVDLDRPVTPDTLRQAVGERDYQRRRDPALFTGVAAGFRSLFPGQGSFDATGKRKAATPRAGVTFRNVLDELGIGSLDAAERAGRRRAAEKTAGTIAGGNGDDTLGDQNGQDALVSASGDKALPDGVLREIAIDERRPRALTEEKVDEFEARYHNVATVLRALGYDFAADSWEKFLAGDGGTKTINRERAREFSPIARAEKTNQGRFEGSFLDSGSDDEPPHQFYEAISRMKDGESKDLGQDYWEVEYDSGDTLVNMVRGGLDLALGAGRIETKFEGSFKATRKGDRVEITGNVRLTLDDLFNFQPGGLGADGALILEEYGRVKQFNLESEWQQTVRGVIKLKDGKPVDASFDWTDEPSEAK